MKQHAVRDTQGPARTSDEGGRVRPSASRANRPRDHQSVSQRSIGNQARQALQRRQGLQAKSTVGLPGDAYEREADRVADAVTQGGSAPEVRELRPQARLQRQAEEDEEDEDEAVQAKALPGQTPAHPAAVAASGSGGGGRPLPDASRSFFESRFGRDLGGVRVHNDAAAKDAARSLRAQAFTRGRDIYFGDGRYEPETTPGRHLIAHELAHTIQQRPGLGRSVQRTPDRATRVSQPGDSFEREAVGAAGEISRGRSVSGRTFSPPPASVVARQAEAAPTPAVEAAPAPAVEGEAPAPADEVINLQGSATFAPAPSIADRFAVADRQTADVAVRFGNLTRESRLNVRRQGESYETTGRDHQSIPLAHPALQPLVNAGIQPVLAVQIRESAIQGFVSIEAGGRRAPNPTALTDWIEEHPREMGWLGFDNLNIPRPVNTLAGGSLRLQVDGFSFRLGGFLNGTASLGLTNDDLTFSADATIEVPHLTRAQLSIRRGEDGRITGRVEIPVEIRNFSGNLIAEYADGTVAIEGTVGYETEKFGGQVTLLVTDAETARSVAEQQLGPDAVVTSAAESSGATGEGPRPGPRALAGYGTINVHMTEWLTGQAQVIIDNEGHVTVRGAITPPAQVELFPQRDFIHEFPRLEVRTLYGVPLVGNVFLFANIGLDAVAKLGPGTLYNIQVIGTYSTDPNVYNNFSLSATLNISAFAGLRLRAEGGAGVELLGHDIKAGIGVNALAGIRGYVEATPTIGYREIAASEEGKVGEFYIKGHMEIAAQPFLGLGGDFFIELDSPWYSPAPDKTWTWPLGDLEYPLPGEFGIGADVDYVIGSGEVPNVEFGEVDFDSSKFLSDLTNDHVPRGSQGEQERPGTYQDQNNADLSQPQVGGESAGPAGDGQAVAPGGDGVQAGSPSNQPARGQQQAGEGAPPDPAVSERWLLGLRALGDLTQTSHRDPLDRSEIESELSRLRTRYGFTELRSELSGADWRVFAAMNPTAVFEDIDAETERAGEDADQFGVNRAEIERRFRHRLDQIEEGYVIALANEVWTVRRGLGRASGAGAAPQVRLVSRENGSYSLEQVQTSDEADARGAHDEILGERPDWVPYLEGHGDYTQGHTGHNFSSATRDAVDEIGYRTGDHSVPSIKLPGTTAIDPATAAGQAGRPNWIPDHQPPDTLLGGGANVSFRFYPHSLPSARIQGGIVSQYKRMMKERRGRGDNDWSKGVRSDWFW